MKKMTQLLALAATVLMTAYASAQAPAYMKYEVNGKPVSFNVDEVNSYNSLEGDGVDEKKHTSNHFYVQTLVETEFKLSIAINTAPRTLPVAGKIPYVEIILPVDGALPSVYLSIDRYLPEDKMSFYSSKSMNPGNFQITKVEGEWVEGTFDLVMPNSYEENDNLTITNGSFRFKIEKEME